MFRLVLFLLRLFTVLHQLATSYDIVNIALQSDAKGKTEYAGALRAVDGNTDTNYHSGSCTHTKAVQDPWWRADFGDTFIVTGVTIHSRSDCCWTRLRNFTVELSRSLSQNKESLEDPSLCSFHFSGAAATGQIFNFECSAPIYARFVQVQIHTAKEYLTLCEVEVWGAKLPPSTCPLFTKTSGRKVSSMIAGVKIENTLQKCFFACLKTLHCNSLNIFTNVTSYMCEFLEDIHELHETDIVETVSWSYYRVLL